MNYKKILFLRMWPDTAWVGGVSPPVGIGYITQYLKRYGCDFKIMDMAIGDRLPDVLSAIRYFNPDVLGVSMLTYKYRNSYAILKRIKDIFSDLTIVAGGAHISTFREKALLECSSIDFGFVRDGEITFSMFCKGEIFEKIPWFIYRNKNSFPVFTSEAQEVLDLDNLPWPKYDGVDLRRYSSKEILILTSRGCPYSCIFCPVSLAIGKRLRTRSTESICKEIEYWFDKGYRRFAILDDNFTFFKERTIAICREIKKRNFKDIKLRCGNGIRADRIDEEVLIYMKEAGFVQISIGVESISENVLKFLQKGETITDIEKAIKSACKLGFDVTLFFLIGSPYETISDVKKYMDFCFKYPIFDVRFYNLIPYPGTELFKWVEKNDYFIKSPSEYLNSQSAFSDEPVFQTPEFTYQERAKMLRESRKVTKKIRMVSLKRKLKKKFLGKIFYYFIVQLYVSEKFQELIRQNKILRRLAEGLYFKL